MAGGFDGYSSSVQPSASSMLTPVSRPTSCQLADTWNTSSRAAAGGRRHPSAKTYNNLFRLKQVLFILQ